MLKNLERCTIVVSCALAVITRTPMTIMNVNDSLHSEKSYPTLRMKINIYFVGERILYLNLYEME